MLEIVVDKVFDNQYFAYAKYDGRNLYAEMTLCDFVENCEFFGFGNVRSGENEEGIHGWYFDAVNSAKDIENQIFGFVNEYDKICLVDK